MNYVSDLKKIDKAYVIETLASEKTQGNLLIVTTALAALSLIPPFRLIGAIALRGAALLANLCFTAKYPDASMKEKILNSVKCSGIVVGIVGLAILSPLHIMASLTIDTAVQTFEMMQALREKKYEKAVICFSAIAINSLIIGAVAVGSWQLAVAASITSTVVFGGLALKFLASDCKNSKNYNKNLYCFTILSVLGTLSALTSAELVTTKKVQDYNRPAMFVKKRTYFDYDHKFHDHYAWNIPMKTVKVTLQTSILSENIPTLPIGANLLNVNRAFHE